MTTTLALIVTVSIAFGLLVAQLTALKTLYLFVTIGGGLNIPYNGLCLLGDACRLQLPQDIDKL